MLKLSGKLQNIPIFSLRTGFRVGTAQRPLINPSNLKIEGWYATSKFASGLLLLPSIEIRELSQQGIAINDHDAITPLEDLVRYQQIIKINYNLLGKQVVTDQGHKLGKVEDFATDIDSFYVQKLYVAPSMLKALTAQQIIISRPQILEVTDKKIVVIGPEVKTQSFFKAPELVPRPTSPESQATTSR